MAVNRYYSSTAVDTVLKTGIDSSATEIVLDTTSGYPGSYPFTIALDYDTSSEELVNIVGVGSVTDSFKIGTTVGTASVTGRGVDGTTAQSHAAGATVKHVFSARDMREAQQHIAADTGVHGITDTATLVNTTDTGTVATAMIASGAVTTAKIADVNVTTGKIADSAVTTAKLNDSSVTSAKIVDGTIVNADISSSAAIAASKISGTAATLTGSETLTNKTLTSPIINGSSLNSTIALGSGATLAMDGSSVITAAGYTISPDEIASLDGSGGTNLNYRISANTSNISTISNDLGVLTNAIYATSTTDTTVSYSGTGWSWGTGATMTTMYKQIGNIVFMDVQLTAGTSPTAGSGSLVINFPSGAPSADTTITELVTAGVLIDSSPTTYYKLTGGIGSSSITIYIDTVTGSNIKISGLTSSTSPITLASGDSIRLSFWYRTS